MDTTTHLLKELSISSAGEDVEELKFSYPAGENVK